MLLVRAKKKLSAETNFGIANVSFEKKKIINSNLVGY
jgi:hypothetical protein